MSASAEYFLVQYVRDPFRREGQNLGVIVIKGTDAAARFFGRKPGAPEIDGRSIKWMPHPHIYRKWVRYWTREIERGGADLKDRLTASSGSHYSLIGGSFVTDTGTDSAEVICNHLFGLLVSTSLIELNPESVADIAMTELRTEISKEFRHRDIMSTTNPAVHHPVFANVEVRGRRLAHHPAYSQRNGELWVMDTVNFMTPRKNPAADHAGLVAKIFDDIRAIPLQTTHPIILYRAGDEELEDPTVQYALAILKDSCEAQINWIKDGEREPFLEERKRIAFAG
jgi:hypothetical protein